MNPKTNEEMVTITLPKSLYDGLSSLLGEFMPVLQQAAAEESAAMTPEQQALQDEMIAMDAAQRRG